MKDTPFKVLWQTYILLYDTSMHDCIQNEILQFCCYCTRSKAIIKKLSEEYYFELSSYSVFFHLFIV